VAQGTIEEGMLSLLKFKKSLFAGVLDGGEKEVFLGGSRLNRFMETVEKATTAIPAAVVEERSETARAVSERQCRAERPRLPQLSVHHERTPTDQPAIVIVDSVGQRSLKRRYRHAATNLDRAADYCTGHRRGDGDGTNVDNRQAGRAGIGYIAEANSVAAEYDLARHGRLVGAGNARLQTCGGVVRDSFVTPWEAEAPPLRYARGFAAHVEAKRFSRVRVDRPNVDALADQP